MWFILLIAACAPRLQGSDTDRVPGSDTGVLDTGVLDTAVADTGSDTGSPEDTAEDTGGPCPPGMALVDDTFCMDRWEAALEERVGGVWSAASPYLTVGSRDVRAVVASGLVPQGYLSGDEAELACEASGKRLCTSDEWLLGCRGPDDHTYPYGDVHDASACNDSYAGGHPVVDYFGTSSGVWDTAHMNDPGINQQAGSLAAAGAHPACVSAWGIADLHGNLHEWVSDAEGTFRGGFYADASLNGAGCSYRTTAHARGYHDYSTGFRCCAEPLSRRSRVAPLKTRIIHR